MACLKKYLALKREPWCNSFWKKKPNTTIRVLLFNRRSLVLQCSPHEETQGGESSGQTNDKSVDSYDARPTIKIKMTDKDLVQARIKKSQKEQVGRGSTALALLAITHIRHQINNRILTSRCFRSVKLNQRVIKLINPFLAGWYDCWKCSWLRELWQLF